jgi:hypothetical protein
MIQKMHLVSNINKSLLKNVEEAQKKQCKFYASRKGLQMFEGFEGEGMKSRCKNLDGKGF